MLPNHGFKLDYDDVGRPDQSLARAIEMQDCRYVDDVVFAPSLAVLCNTSSNNRVAVLVFIVKDVSEQDQEDGLEGVPREFTVGDEPNRFLVVRRAFLPCAEKWEPQFDEGWSEINPVIVVVLPASVTPKNIRDWKKEINRKIRAWRESRKAAVRT
jgi:hypothetical protein